MRRLIAVLSLVVLLFCACGSVSQTYHVEYRVTGTTNSADLTYENKTGDTEQQNGQYVPWSLKFDAVTNQFLYISAQNNHEGGSIVCHIFVNDVEVKTATSQGAYVIATCSGRL